MEYNTFAMTNMKTSSPNERLSQIFKAMSTPARLQILMAIGKGEACVCHLEALLALRQAYISQQLMDMRDAALVDTRREGRYIYYRLTEPQLLDRLLDIGKLFGIVIKEIDPVVDAAPLPQCSCPACLAKLDSAYISPENIPTQK